MNKITIFGRLTKDIETKALQSGKTLANISIASNGKNKEETNFFDCKAFSGLADTMAKYLHKGDAVIIYGSMHQFSYDKQDGTKVRSWEVLVDDIDFVPKAKSGDNTEPTGMVEDTSEEVKLPF